MDRDELRRVQSPLKDRYKEDADAAMITLRASGELGSEEVSCSVETGRAMVEAGLHPASGGDGSLACSGDMLLQALVACAGVTLRSVATNRGLDVSGTVRAEGDLDFRGTMGVDRDAAVGFTDIRLSFDLQSDAAPEDLDSIIKTTERYCVVLQTLTRSPNLSVSYTPAVA
ncbi:MAG TPA: OsmC family protein [Acidimicrobiales bacterium]|nr:OsmC family protein [Acidimicrobiales bacterium]